jgi:hypothetical protein
VDWQPLIHHTEPSGGGSTLLIGSTNFQAAVESIRRYPTSITLRMSSWASISSKPRLTSSK